MTTTTKTRGRKGVPAARGIEEPSIAEQAIERSALEEQAAVLVEDIIRRFGREQDAFLRVPHERKRALSELALRWSEEQAACSRAAQGLPKGASLSLQDWQAVADVPAEADLLRWGGKNCPQVAVPDLLVVPSLPAEDEALLRRFAAHPGFYKTQVKAREFLRRVAEWQAAWRGTNALRID